MQELVATVHAVIMGKHGKFVVTNAEEVIGSITFSLDEKVWQESREPEAGEYVILSDLTQKRAGWRANTARFYRYQDEVSSTQH